MHDLLRELPYADLSATRRQSLHRRVGERLESRRASGKAVAAAVLADHFRNAEDRAKAFGYTIEAAEAALEAYAFNNAIVQLESAQKLLPADAEPRRDTASVEMLGIAYGLLGPARRRDRGLHAGPRSRRRPDRASDRPVWDRRGIPAQGAFRQMRSANSTSPLARSDTRVPKACRGPARHMEGRGLFPLLPRRLGLPGGAPDGENRIEIAFAVVYRLARCSRLAACSATLHVLLQTRHDR